jgi:hypothetical protein
MHEKPNQNIDTATQELTLDTSTREYSIGFLKNQDSEDPLLITIEQLGTLVESGLHVMVERGFGEPYQISDLMLSETGVELCDNPIYIISKSQVLIQYTPFTDDQVPFMRERQILLSCVEKDSIDHTMAQILYKLKISAIALNRYKDRNGMLFLPFILDSNYSFQDQTYALGVLLSSLIQIFSHTNNLKNSVRWNPELVSSVYLFYGNICDPLIAKHAQVPWKDLLDLCWG